VASAIIFGLLGAAVDLIYKRDQAKVAEAAKLGELPVTVRMSGGAAQVMGSDEAVQNKLFISIPIELTNTDSSGVSVEVWMKVIDAKGSEVYLGSLSTPHPHAPRIFIAIPGDFLGHVINIPGHTTVPGYVTFMVYQTGDSRSLSVFGAKDMREFLTAVPTWLELRDRVSSRRRVYDVFNGDWKYREWKRRIH
jgi:hypothetical protein